MTEDNSVYVLPMWGEATIAHVLCPSLPSEQERAEILRRIRDARLAEVEQIEIAMQISPRTSEIRRDYKQMRFKLDKLEQEKDDD